MWLFAGWRFKTQAVLAVKGSYREELVSDGSRSDSPTWSEEDPGEESHSYNHGGSLYHLVLVARGVQETCDKVLDRCALNYELRTSAPLDLVFESVGYGPLRFLALQAFILFNLSVVNAEFAWFYANWLKA
ncbi:hypothetical protein FIBSPDRAFT_904228 [Athelia psychrophila]|uniref:Uncharacterized protein n=1 Tax=Athelia psychrophila TaxID=1759441 RepID=A0A167V070_9AGAM|nr:hypothetical protein FIBSPDRAFT_904228 [Fibularhizoctonia sp. CBS 109695]